MGKDSINYIYAASILIFSIIFSNGLSFAGSDNALTKPVHCIDPDQQINFAATYFSDGDYNRAISEYNRFRFLFPEDQRVELARYQIGKSYYNAHQYDNALKEFTRLVREYGQTELGVKAYFGISECFVKMKDFRNAVANLEHLAGLTDNQPIKDEAFYRIGWIYVEAADWDKSRLYFNQISQESENRYATGDLLAELDEVNSIPSKNPGLAGFLSVIPGGGYLYCNRYQDALMAFLLNGGMMWAAYESFDNGNPALGAVIAFVESGFYAGNIYGGMNSAHKFNRAGTRHFIENLKRRTKISLLADPFNKKLGIFFESDY